MLWALPLPWAQLGGDAGMDIQVQKIPLCGSSLHGNGEMPGKRVPSQELGVLAVAHIPVSQHILGMVRNCMNSTVCHSCNPAGVEAQTICPSRWSMFLLILGEITNFLPHSSQDFQDKHIISKQKKETNPTLDANFVKDGEEQGYSSFKCPSGAPSPCLNSWTLQDWD